MSYKCEANRQTSSHRSKSGQQFKQGERISGTNSDGQRVSGAIDSFVGRSHQTAVIREGGYTYTIDINDAD